MIPQVAPSLLSGANTPTPIIGEVHSQADQMSLAREYAVRLLSQTDAHTASIPMVRHKVLPPALRVGAGQDGEPIGARWKRDAGPKYETPKAVRYCDQVPAPTSIFQVAR